MPSSKEVTIIYLSALRERSGHQLETFFTESRNSRDLYQEVAERYGLPSEAKGIRVAINGELKRWNTILNANDWVVFITPEEWVFDT